MLRLQSRRLRPLACFLPKLVCGLWLMALLAGCSTVPAPRAILDRARFDFQKDTFAYANELVWEYEFDDATGERTTRRREPAPNYTHHCFVVARSARQFFQHARFDAALSKVDGPCYRSLIRRVITLDPAEDTTALERVVIPGYANLREFSAAEAALLQSECGGAWQSYLQRGHWRMVFPFSRDHQVRTVEGLLGALKQNRPPVVHIVRFPQLSINHAILLFDAKESDREVVFSVYDPNAPEQPVKLTFDRGTRTFTFPRNLYFAGGRVDVYEIYRNWRY